MSVMPIMSEQVSLEVAQKIIKILPSPTGFGEQQDELDASFFESKLPIQHSHSAYENEELGLYVGVWDTTDMIEAAGAYPCEEFMAVIEGAVEIKNNKTGAIETVLAGESFVIPQGYDCQWHQKGYLRKFYVISELSDDSASQKPQGIKKIPRRPLNGYTINYTSPKGDFIVGTWQGLGIEVDEAPSLIHKFIYLDSGQLTVTEENGQARIIKAGESLFIPSGTAYKWQTQGKTIQHWVELISK